MRPIDADVLLKKRFKVYDGTEAVGADDIENAPTLDYVPVVRCKYCLFSEEKHYLGDTCLYCKQFCDFMEESDFCCRAERKDGEQNA